MVISLEAGGSLEPGQERKLHHLVPRSKSADEKVNPT